MFYVYILINKWNHVLYTGVTNNLGRRVYEHLEKMVESFTKKYNVTKLVYYEVFSDAISAITGEKTNKSGFTAEENRFD